MSEYDRESRERRWSQALRTHGDRVAQRPPSAHLTAEAGDLRPGRALDAAEAMGEDVAERVEWVEADLGSWAPERDAYDLVVCLSVESALAALDPGRWERLVAEERTRPAAGSGVDAVIRARRRS